MGINPQGMAWLIRGAQSGPDRICSSRTDQHCRTEDRFELAALKQRGWDLLHGRE